MKKRLKSLLLWSQKYTKTDMVYLTRNGFWLGLGHGIQIISGLVLAVSFANLLSKQSFGVYQFIMSIAAVLSVITLSGMGVAIKRAIANGNEKALRYGFQKKMLWNVGIVLASGALSTYYFINDNTDLAKAFLIVGALTPFIEGFTLYKPYYIGTKRFKKLTLLGLFRRPLLIAVILPTLYFTKDPVTIVGVYFLTSAVTAGIIYRHTIKKYALKYSPAPETLTYSKHLSVMSIVGSIGNHIDKILIFHFLGAASVAIYAIALLPATHLLKMFSLVGGELIFPKFVKRGYAELQKSLARKVSIFFIVTLGIVILYIFSAPYIYATLFPTYYESIVLSQVAILALLTKPNMLYGQVFSAHAIKKVQYFIRISTTMLNILLLWILLPLYGLWGAIFTFIGVHIYWGIAVTLIFYIRKQ